ncbi:MAG: methylglyoxal synthase [Clostridia bacterium]|nr:methylglyoxal synthase [Clostridia bacterium]MBR6745534.1 methylglyoxal synthase [Clostridia bacterium]
MEIALISSETKRELMIQFCIAYCGVLAKHNICATKMTGKCVAEATGLEIEQLLPGSQGGVQQIASRIAYNEIDVLLYFKEKTDNPDSMLRDAALMQECDRSNVPTATNIATAEAIITALDRGDLDWREIWNPKSEYNRRRKKA